MITETAPCPNCGSMSSQKVNWTLWGGALGPRIMNHVKCANCGTTFNAKTGQSNQSGIILYLVITSIAGIGLVAMLCVCLFAVLAASGQ